jgi:hypothetical protein
MSVRTARSDGTVVTAPIRDDLLVVLLPLPLLVGALASILGGVSLPLGVGAGALPSALVFRDAVTAAAPAR